MVVMGLRGVHRVSGAFTSGETGSRHETRCLDTRGEELS